MFDRLLVLATDEHVQLILLGIVNLFTLLINQRIARRTHRRIEQLHAGLRSR